eukprot:TRINITY_DN1996_c1_g1_i1.p1 TRINITY_DN1996_c1_g1~~TRINITY_DN1996_c1_g1_i1.p1  ORF type:complete len:338 (+),score=62.46 TRINITY_DN1996_c1_g1_i1:90-1016(+)
MRAPRASACPRCLSPSLPPPPPSPPREASPGIRRASPDSVRTRSRSARSDHGAQVLHPTKPQPIKEAVFPEVGVAVEDDRPARRAPRRGRPRGCSPLGREVSRRPPLPRPPRRDPQVRGRPRRRRRSAPPDARRAAHQKHCPVPQTPAQQRQQWGYSLWIHHTGRGYVRSLSPPQRNGLTRSWRAQPTPQLRPHVQQQQPEVPHPGGCLWDSDAVYDERRSPKNDPPHRPGPVAEGAMLRQQQHFALPTRHIHILDPKYPEFQLGEGARSLTTRLQQHTYRAAQEHVASLLHERTSLTPPVPKLACCL